MKNFLILILFTINSVFANPPVTIVIFGATGDLASRKLFPALEQLTDHPLTLIGTGRSAKTDGQFRQELGTDLNVFYHQLHFDNASDYHALAERIEANDKELGTKSSRIFFLATQPCYFLPIVENLKKGGLLFDPHQETWSRIMIEKPFGSDLESAILLHEELSKYLDDSQIYRIDHYLGKEGVRELLPLRQKLVSTSVNLRYLGCVKARDRTRHGIDLIPCLVRSLNRGNFHASPNSVNLRKQTLEPYWNCTYIDHIQITLSEEVGIGTRGTFWEETGYLRDIFQNHLMQILALLTMEPPHEAIHEEIHKEIHAAKIEVLKAVEPVAFIRGQYAPGVIQGANVPGYIEEKDVSSDSSIETFAAAKFLIHTPRWKGVPIYVRGGKRLPEQTVQIAVKFKKIRDPLIIRIQPNPALFFKAWTKQIGDSLAPEAYELLFEACLKGDQSLFVSIEEQLIAWSLLTPILKKWQEEPLDASQLYPAGTWGPEAAKKLIENDGRKWIMNSNSQSLHSFLDQ